MEIILFPGIQVPEIQEELKRSSHRISKRDCVSMRTPLVIIIS